MGMQIVYYIIIMPLILKILDNQLFDCVHGCVHGCMCVSLQQTLIYGSNIFFYAITSAGHGGLC